MRIDVFHHGASDDVTPKLNQILALLQALTQKENIMIQEMTDLVAEVNDVKTVQGSAVVAIQGLVDKFNQAIQGAADLAEAKAAAVQLTADLKEATTPLAAAIANVPA